MDQRLIKEKLQRKQNLLKKYPQIFENNPEWGRIQYLLQMFFSNISITINKMYLLGRLFTNIAKSNDQDKFFSRNEGKTIFDVILLESQLRKDEDFSSVCNRGLKNVLNFIYGQLDFDKLSKDPLDYYEIMVAKAAVGKTFMFPSKNITEDIPYEKAPELMTDEFDSVYLYEQNSINREIKQNFIIYDSQQKCLPYYIIQFHIDGQKSRDHLNKQFCQICDDHNAYNYCETEDAYLCNQCDKKHHHNKLAHKHKRVKVSSKQKVCRPCSLHPESRLELFCIQCGIPLCVSCKIKGSHSTGEMMVHNVVRIMDKYHETERNMQTIDEVVEKKKQYLKDSVLSVDNALKEVNYKSNQVQQKIYQIVQSVLKKLQNITKGKMSLLMADHLQLKRQLDLLQWSQKFIKYQYKVLSPSDFLLSWCRHKNLINQIVCDNFSVAKVLSEIKIEGQLNVISDKEQSKPVHHMLTSQLGDKSTIFRKNQDKISMVLKSKTQHQKQITQEIQTSPVKSVNNMLNLSVLKHL